MLEHTLPRYRVHLLIASSTNLIIILVMMQASKKIPFDDPNVFLGIRALYIVSNLIIVGIYVYVGMQIDKKKGTQRSFIWRMCLFACGTEY